jgi:hypothetical protein
MFLPVPSDKDQQGHQQEIEDINGEQEFPFQGKQLVYP